MVMIGVIDRNTIGMEQLNGAESQIARMKSARTTPNHGNVHKLTIFAVVH